MNVITAQAIAAVKQRETVCFSSSSAGWAVKAQLGNMVMHWPAASSSCCRGEAARPGTHRTVGCVHVFVLICLPKSWQAVMSSLKKNSNKTNQPAKKPQQIKTTSHKQKTAHNPVQFNNQELRYFSFPLTWLAQNPVVLVLKADATNQCQHSFLISLLLFLPGLAGWCCWEPYDNTKHHWDSFCGPQVYKSYTYTYPQEIETLLSVSTG